MSLSFFNVLSVLAASCVSIEAITNFDLYSLDLTRPETWHSCSSSASAGIAEGSQRVIQCNCCAASFHKPQAVGTTKMNLITW